MKKYVFGFKIILSILTILFLLLTPGFLKGSINKNLYEDWIKGDKNDYNAIINVWHVVGFKPYMGSLGGSISTVVKVIENRHDGIYFEVNSMDIEEYKLRISRGEYPDVLSYPLGLCYPDMFLASNTDISLLKEELKHVGMWEGELLSLPYALSGYILLENLNLKSKYNIESISQITDDFELTKHIETIDNVLKNKKPNINTISGNVIISALNNIEHDITEYDTFKSGKAILAISDMRAASDLYNLQNSGKGFSYNAYPFDNYTDLIQMIGIVKKHK